MPNKGHSDPNFLGGYTHYDENGKKIGHSDLNFLGGYTIYDANGKKIGHSDPNLLGGYTHYDNNGNRTGRSDVGLTGFVNYDKNGKRISSSNKNMLGGYTHSEGCYIATCVYGSYDCPEVWTLRRFRDYGLRRNTLGRIFIRIYYRSSPILVRLFGKNRLFQNINRAWLDRFVRKLKQCGYLDDAYVDTKSYTSF